MARKVASKPRGPGASQCLHESGWEWEGLRFCEIYGDDDGDAPAPGGTARVGELAHALRQEDDAAEHQRAHLWLRVAGRIRKQTPSQTGAARASTRSPTRPFDPFHPPCRSARCPRTRLASLRSRSTRCSRRRRPGSSRTLRLKRRATRWRSSCSRNCTAPSSPRATATPSRTRRSARSSRDCRHAAPAPPPHIVMQMSSPSLARSRSRVGASPGRSRC